METLDKGDRASKIIGGYVLAIVCAIIALIELLAVAYFIVWFTSTARSDPDALLPILTTLKWTGLVIGIMIGTLAGLFVPPFFFLLPLYLALLYLLGQLLLMVVQGWWYILTAPFRGAWRLVS